MSYPDEREYQLEYPTDDTPAFRLADMAPKRRRPAWVIPLACMLAVAVLAGGAGAWAYSVRASIGTAAPVPLSSTAASPSPSTSPSLEVAQLDEELACIVLVPLMSELLSHAEKMLKTKQLPDKAAVTKLEADLRDLHSRAPQDMRSDITELVQAASTMLGGAFYGSQASGPGVRLLERCRKYARPD